MSNRRCNWTQLFLQGVDYKGIKDSPKFQQYVQHTAELIRVDIASATREEKLAFFINVYNALVIHANVQNGPPANLWQRYKVPQFQLSSRKYCLADCCAWFILAGSQPRATTHCIVFWLATLLC